jgi:hypothetical protein
MLDPYINGRAQSLMGFEGSEDCMLKVKVAYGEMGLYLWIEAIDDQYMDPIPPDTTIIDGGDTIVTMGTEEWLTDAVDFYLDIFSSQQQKEGRFITSGDQRTATMTQFQYRYGIESAGSIVRINGFDPAWTGVGDPFKYETLRISEAFQRGILFEVVTLDECRKVQEWFIPWNRAGAGMDMPVVGQKIAFTAGYNDIDAGETMPDILRWKNLCDPYCNSDNWGDIEFGPSLE